MPWDHLVNPANTNGPFIPTDEVRRIEFLASDSSFLAVAMAMRERLPRRQKGENVRERIAFGHWMTDEGKAFFASLDKLADVLFIRSSPGKQAFRQMAISHISTDYKNTPRAIVSRDDNSGAWQIIVPQDANKKDLDEAWKIISESTKKEPTRNREWEQFNRDARIFSRYLELKEDVDREKDIMTTLNEEFSKELGDEPTHATTIVQRTKKRLGKNFVDALTKLKDS